MVQKMVPCLFMRGGTSRGAYFLKEHLPSDRETLDKVLLAVMGSPDPLQIDGLGGGGATTSKVALLATSDEPGVDIDFHFAQVSVTTAMVDWGPTCGNILAGVGPAALEMGLIRKVGWSETKIRIRLVNTGSFVEAVVQTPGGQVTRNSPYSILGFRDFFGNFEAAGMNRAKQRFHGVIQHDQRTGNTNFDDTLV